MDDRRTQSNWCLAPKEQDPQEGEEGHLHRKEPHQGERSPLEGSGYGGHLGRRNRAAELPHHQKQVRGLSPLQKLGSPQMEIQGMEEEALPGAATVLPCPYFEYHPSWRGSEFKENEEASKDFDLEDLLELGLEVDCFLQGPVESSEEENR